MPKPAKGRLEVKKSQFWVWIRSKNQRPDYQLGNRIRLVPASSSSLADEIILMLISYWR